jgi:hypothetical protein
VSSSGCGSSAGGLNPSGGPDSRSQPKRCTEPGGEPTNWITEPAGSWDAMAKALGTPSRAVQKELADSAPHSGAAYTMDLLRLG